MNGQELFDFVKQRLEDGTPTSIVRAGDGEAIFLTGFDDIENLKSVCKRQFGYILQIDHIEQIQGYLIEAIKDCDVFGVKLNPREGLSKYWIESKEIFEKHAGPKQNLVSIDFHNDWLLDDKYSELLTGRAELCYISCRNLDLELKTKYGIKNIYSYIIAPEAKFTSYTGPNHYPDQFHDILRTITRWPVEGNLCLVGAGIVGKVYNKWLKERGGISLDIGNVFDAWAGKATRGPGRGLNKTDDTYKL